jgi:streptogramin lyase
MQPAASVPHDVAVDPSGIAWAAKRGGNVLPHGALLRFDPHTLEVTEWYAPPPNGKPVGHAPSGQPFLGNPQIDSHGVLWTQDGSSQRWLSFNTHTLKWTAYPVPAGHIAIGNALAFTPNGVVWSSDERAGIYSFNPKTGEWHFYKSHLPKSGAYGLAVAGDGTVWFAEDAVDHMGHVYPDTGKEEDLQIPLKGRLYPRRMAADGYGNIWVGLWQVGKLMKIDYKTKKMTFFTPPTRVPGLYSVTVDKVHDIIWVSEQQADKIARFDPRTGKWLEFALPNIQSDDRRISIDPTDPNRIFFSGVSADLIGFLEYQPR